MEGQEDTMLQRTKKVVKNSFYIKGQQKKVTYKKPRTPLDGTLNQQKKLAEKLFTSTSAEQSKKSPIVTKIIQNSEKYSFTVTSSDPDRIFILKKVLSF